MNNAIVAYFTQAYAKKSAQLRTKSQILCLCSLILCMASILFGLIMFVTGAVVVGVVCASFFVFCLSVLILLRLGRYSFASSVFLFGFFLIMFSAIKFDAYKNVYECYVFGTLGCFLLVTGSLLASHPWQTIVLCVLDLVAIAIIYVADTLLARPVVAVETLDIQSLFTSGAIVILCGAFASIIVIIQNRLLEQASRENEKAFGNYLSLNKATMAVQSSAMGIGGRLAEKSRRTIEAATRMAGNVKEILLGIDELTKALEESQNANSKSVNSQEIVMTSLASYTQEVSHASAAIEEMAAAVASIGNQANIKRDAVRALVDQSRKGEESLVGIRNAISHIAESAKSMMEMSVFIEDVAERTNLLGLNASIEAAHAGQSGRGFAVVADQIRALSVETGKSSRVISDMLKETMSAIASADAQNAEAGSLFKRINGDILGVGQMMEELLGNIQEISDGAHDVLRAVETVASLTVSTEATVQDSRQTIGLSTKGIQAVTVISGKVKLDVQDIVGDCDAVISDAREVQGLGDENLGVVEGLKRKLEEIGKTASSSQA